MALISLVLGVLASVGVAIAMIPLLGWLNWLILPLPLAGLVLGIVAGNRSEPGRASCGTTLAILLNCLALGFGIVRLLMGGGVV